VLLKKLLPYLKRQQPIPITLMVAAFNEVAGGIKSSERRRIADEILKGAGQYLEYWQLGPFISAALSDDEARELIARRKAFIERAADLVPSLLPLFQVQDESSLRYVLVRLDDCCYDFPLIRRSPHKNKQKKSAVARLERLREQIASLGSMLESVGDHVAVDFESHMSAVAELRKDPTGLGVSYYEKLKEELNCLALTAKVVLHKTEHDKGGIYLSDNRASTHVVECTYAISLWLRSPTFVTTPGSDFSVACSLLYELASGESDRGLAGAISRFARSDLRRNLDEEARETRWENSDEGMLSREANNFAHIAEHIAKLCEEREFWENLISSRRWKKFEEFHLNVRLLHVVNLIDAESSQYGPFLVWADQIVDDTGDGRGRKLEEWDAQELQAEIAQRRKTKNS
jgi:hypothetical protein